MTSFARKNDSWYVLHDERLYAPPLTRFTVAMIRSFFRKKTPGLCVRRMLVIGLLCSGCASYIEHDDLSSMDRDSINKYCGTDKYYIICNDTCTDSVSRETCGTCTNACPETADCVPYNNGPGYCVCKDPGESYCDNACYDLQTHPTHCGSCQHSCADIENAENTNIACADANCLYTCKSGFENCDHDFATGCEVSLMDDDNNCGACGKACPANTHCSAGTCSSCPKGFVKISAGTYTLGSADNEAGREADNDHASVENVENKHSVTLTHDFCIMVYELSQAEYTQYVEKTAIPNDAYDKPKSGLSWHDAALVSVRMSEANGLTPCYTCTTETSEGKEVARCQAIDAFSACNGYRLPTDAEWEIAARGGSEGTFYHIQETVTDAALLPQYATQIAWMSENEKRAHTRSESRSVAAHKNAYQIYDVAGNLMEWTHDRFYPVLTDSSYTDPVFSPESANESRVLRGGSYMSKAASCRHAARYLVDGTSHSGATGVRLAITLFEAQPSSDGE